MKDIMIATSNENKVREYKEMLENIGYRVHSLKELGDFDIDENGTTFKENALIKARSVFDKCAMTVIADDSGLMIEALNNEPGIYSARYLAGHTYQEKNEIVLERMKGVKNRKATFVCAIAIIDENGDHVFQGELVGEIGYEQKGTNGFGYDPIFYNPSYGKTNAELEPEVKNSMSHRGQATRMLLEYLNKKEEKR